MAEKPGHFEKGVWIEDKPPAPKPDPELINRRLSEATKGVIASIDTMMSVTHDLVSTDEGKQYIEKTLKDTQAQIQQSLDTFVSRAKTELDKAKAELEKTKADLDKKIKQ